MKTMTVERGELGHDHRLHQDAWCEVWVRTPFGEVCAHYRSEGDCCAWFEMDISGQRYRVSAPGRSSPEKLVSTARAFAEQCHAMHEKGGA